jgi:hypothetical protein
MTYTISFRLSYLADLLTVDLKVVLLVNGCLCDHLKSDGSENLLLSLTASTTLVASTVPSVSSSILIVVVVTIAWCEEARIVICELYGVRAGPI